MRVLLVLLALFTTILAKPASAAVFLGHLRGVVTSGGLSYFALPPGELSPIPSMGTNLTGLPIDIFFRAEADVPDQDFDYIRYTFTDVIVRLDLTYSEYGFAYLGDEIRSSSNTNIGHAYYTGDARSGELLHHVYDPSANISQFVMLSFSGAQSVFAPLVGRGSANAVFYEEYQTLYYVDYTLVSGRVVQLAVPEPSAWALLIVGFGATGFGLRRKRRVPQQVVARS